MVSAAERRRDPSLYRERIVHWSRDVSFVIDQLTVLDRGNGPFARRLDLERGVGVLGHSRGGQAAGTVRLLDERGRGGRAPSTKRRFSGYSRSGIASWEP
ncbi:MAG: hypothetical protein ACR2L2_06410 [Acidobacteriota bacterium]